MSKFKNSWLLMKRSCEVLLKNKKLFFFPAISFGFAVFIFLFFFSFFLFQPTGYSYTSAKHWDAVFGLDADKVNTTAEKKLGENNKKNILESQSSIETEGSKNTASATSKRESSEKLTPIKDENSINDSQNKEHHVKIKSKLFSNPILILIYLISMILMTFFNTAFFNEIIHALNDQPVSIIGGLKFAITKWKSVLSWALLAATVGVILRKIEENFSFIGRFVIGLIGIAWSVATVFAIPIIIRNDQNSNPIKVLKSSGRLIKQKWGEGLIGYIGFETFGFLFCLSFSLLCGSLVLIAYSMELSGYYMIAIGVFWFFILITVFYIQGIVNNIFKCALYLYASEGVLPLGFDEESLNSVWKVKKK